MTKYLLAVLVALAFSAPAWAGCNNSYTSGGSGYCSNSCTTTCNGNSCTTTC